MLGDGCLCKECEVAVLSAALVDACDLGGLKFLIHGRILRHPCHRKERERETGTLRAKLTEVQTPCGSR